MAQVDPTGVTATGAGASPGAPPARSRTVNLGRGVVVPYPEPTSEAASKIGRRNRRTDTKPEIALRSALHARGLRFRKDHVIRLGDVRARPDVAFTRWTLAVFVDGCFWHQCPEHGATPRSNASYWSPKLQANVERDRRTDLALRDGGWSVIHVWEHEATEAAADRIASTLEALHRGERM